MSKPEYPALFSLNGKTAVITGASGDLGVAMAGALAEAGASVVAAALDDERFGESVEQLRRSCGDRLLAVPTDVTSREQVRQLMKKAVDQFGQIDVLITAAGVQVRKAAADFTDDDWQHVLSVNLTGTFLCCQEAARYMMAKRHGRIITVTSLAAEIGIPNMAAYVASRGGIRQLTKALAVEWAKYGINVNAIGPGRFRTRMTEDLFSDEAVTESFLKLIPAGRAGVPEDLAGVTVFLASDASTYLTGQTIYIDGGWLAGGGQPAK
jgi:NAD(P)-dependent dehydrogenase (short-subunit alcohol dehydrogenase family)